MTDPTRDFKTISAATWRKMLRLGHSMDLEKGGLFDARSGCINVWVSPEDHPPSWNGVQITRGALSHPRGYLGGIMAQLTDDLSEAVLTLEVTPYDRVPQRQMGQYPPPEEDEWEWIQAKAQHLLDLAERIIEPPGSENSIFCRFCDAPVKVSIFNDFLDHLVAAHQLTITAVEMGQPTVVITNVGRLEV